MKPKKEQNALKKKSATQNNELASLNDEALGQVAGGFGIGTVSGEYGLIELGNDVNLPGQT